MDVVAIATITPLRLRAGIEGRGWNVFLLFFRWNITISIHLQVESHTYLYTCVMFCILLCCSLFLVQLSITKQKHEEVCNLCNLRHVEKRLCKESGDEVFSFGGPWMDPEKRTEAANVAESMGFL